MQINVLNKGLSWVVHPWSCSCLFCGSQGACIEPEPGTRAGTALGMFSSIWLTRADRKTEEMEVSWGNWKQDPESATHSPPLSPPHPTPAPPETYPDNPNVWAELLRIRVIINFWTLLNMESFLKVGTGLTSWLSSKEHSCQCRRCRLEPWVRKVPWRRKWQPAPVFLPGKPHGQRSLVGYSPWGHKRVRHDLVTKRQSGHSGSYPYLTMNSFKNLMKCLDLFTRKIEKSITLIMQGCKAFHDIP